VNEFSRMSVGGPGRGPQRLLMVLAIIVPGLALAQTPAPSEKLGMPLPDAKAAVSWRATLDQLERPRDMIVAEVGARTITRGDVVDAIRTLPPIIKAVPFPQLFQQTTELLMQREALVLAAKSSRLDQDPEVERRMQNAADAALANELLRRSIDAKVTETALHGLYDIVVAGKPGPDTVHARIIMVDSMEEATQLIQRLRNGADFPDLARDFSKDGSASNGGDLGYVRLDMMAPELGAVSFALAPGQTTEYPVSSGNRWFIIRVEGRTQQLAPEFAAARQALEQDVVHAAAPELSRMALHDITSKYYGLTGRPTADQAVK
jgi:peptidyl-prolyl cis-trans isomerase C